MSHPDVIYLCRRSYVRLGDHVSSQSWVRATGVSYLFRSKSFRRLSVSTDLDGARYVVGEVFSPFRGRRRSSRDGRRERVMGESEGSVTKDGVWWRRSPTELVDGLTLSERTPMETPRQSWDLQGFCGLRVTSELS